MHGAARLRRDRAAVDELQRRVELLGEVFRTAAIIGEGGDGGDGVLVAGDRAEGRLHAPNGDERPGGHAVALLDGGEEPSVLRLLAPALGNDGRGAALLHEG